MEISIGNGEMPSPETMRCLDCPEIALVSLSQPATFMYIYFHCDGVRFMQIVFVPMK